MFRRVVAVLWILALAQLAGCAALGQHANEIVTREPGARTLGKPMPIEGRAVEDRDFA